MVKAGEILNNIIISYNTYVTILYINSYYTTSYQFFVARLYFIYYLKNNQKLLQGKRRKGKERGKDVLQYKFVL